MTDEMKYTLVSDKGLHELSLEGSPTILVVDDEELMREVTQLIIEEHGGKALVAGSGEEAIEIMEQHKDEVNYVFLDFSMPGLNGYETYLKLREISPKFGTVFASGLKMSDSVEELCQKKQAIFISKPFHEVELLKAVKQLKEQNRC